MQFTSNDLTIFSLIYVGMLRQMNKILDTLYFYVYGPSEYTKLDILLNIGFSLKCLLHFNAHVDIGLFMLHSK